MLLKLSPAVAAALLVLWSRPADSFDKERFYSRDSVAIEAKTSGLPVKVYARQDQFEIGPSGRIDRIRDSKVLNIIGATTSKPIVPNGDGDAHEVDGNSDLNKNTIYSFLHTAQQQNCECGPSPLTAAEIKALVVRTAATYGVDPGLAKAIAWTESRYDQNRNSDQGARGTMQLMPGTAADLGVGDVCDPVSNIDGGVRHLKRMLDEFRNPILAVAAYNAGAQAVYDNGGVPPFPETVRYVAAVINHQMGLQVRQKSLADGGDHSIEPTASEEMASDVIGAQGSRFVKGVMQF